MTEDEGMTSKREEGRPTTPTPAAKALEIVRQIEDKSNELIALAEQIVEEWRTATPRVSEDELASLRNKHTKIGREVLSTAAILLGQMWREPARKYAFVEALQGTTTMNDYINTALDVAEAFAGRRASTQ